MKVSYTGKCKNLRMLTCEVFKYVQFNTPELTHFELLFHIGYEKETETSRGSYLKYTP